MKIYLYVRKSFSSDVRRAEFDTLAAAEAERDRINATDNEVAWIEEEEE